MIDNHSELLSRIHGLKLEIEVIELQRELRRLKAEEAGHVEDEDDEPGVSDRVGILELP